MKKKIWLIVFLIVVFSATLSPVTNMEKVTASSPKVLYLNRNKSSMKDGVGTYSDPYYKFVSVLNAASDGDIIMFQSELILSGQFQISKSLTFMTADVDMNGNPMMNSVVISRNNGFLNGSMFMVKNGKTLTLENIVIDGRLNQTTEATGANIYLEGTASNYSTLVMLDGAIITGGNRSDGGSGVFLSYGTIQMYGGEITGNYSNKGAAAIGVANSKAGKYDLYGGKIYDNISAGYAVNGGDTTKAINIGGDFEIYNNVFKDDPTVKRNMVVNDASILEIQSDFEGTVYFNTVNDIERFDVLGSIDDEMIESIEGIYSDKNPDLYIRQENGKLIWDYHYADYIETVEPTTTSTGELRAYALLNEGEDMSDSIYNAVEVPVLNDADYTITLDELNEQVTYVWKDVSYGVIVDVDLPLLPYDDPSYHTDVLIEPSALQAGSFTLTNPAYPGLEIHQIAPSLNDVDYEIDVVSEPTDSTEGLIRYTLKGTNVVVEKSIPALTDESVLWDIIAYPDVDDVGEVAGTVSSLPGYQYKETLPMLNEVDYDLSVDEENEEVVYALKDKVHGDVVVDLPLIPYDDVSYSTMINLNASETTEGSFMLTNPAYPGLEISKTAPVLNADDYEIVIIDEATEDSEGIIQYHLKGTRYFVQKTIPRLTDDAFAWTIVSEPSANTLGKVLGVVDGAPGYQYVMDLPVLNEDDYTINVLQEPTDDTTGEMTYALDGTDYVFNHEIPAFTDEQFDWQVVDNPSASETGLVVGSVNDLPGYQHEETLPVLSGDQYDIHVDESLQEVVYTLKDKVHGEIDVELELLPYDDSSYQIDMVKQATASETGSFILTNPVYPDLEIEKIAPVLNDQDYRIDVIMEPTDLSDGMIEYVLEGTDYYVQKEIPRLVDESYQWTVVKHPSNTEIGTVIGVTDTLPGYEYENSLPILSDQDYDIVLDEVNEQVVYTLKDKIHGEIDVELDLLPYDDTSYQTVISNQATAIETGNYTLTNPAYPDLEIEKIAPLLNTEDYELIVVSEPSDTAEGLIQYRLKGTNVVVEKNIPRTNDLSITWSVSKEPTAVDEGQLVGVATELPGYQYKTVLPKLSENDYDIEVDLDATRSTEGMITYTLKESDVEIHKDIPRLTDPAYEWTVSKEPSGEVRGQIDGSILSLPGYEYHETLPVLGDEDYEIAVDEEANEVLYTYKDPAYGVVDVSLPLVAYHDSSYTVTVDKVPTPTEEGLYQLTHPSYPGLVISKTAPVLSEEGYDVLFDEDIFEVTYTLKDESEGVFEFTATLPDLSDESYDMNVKKPGMDTLGEIKFTINDYPGVSITKVLDELNEANYSIVMGDHHFVANVLDPEWSFISLTYDKPEVESQSYDSVIISSSQSFAICPEGETLNDKTIWYAPNNDIMLEELLPNQTYDMYCRFEDNGQMVLYPCGQFQTESLPITYYTDQVEKVIETDNLMLLEEIDELVASLEEDLLNESNEAIRQALTDDCVEEVSLLIQIDEKKQAITDVYNDLKTKNEYTEENENILDERYNESLIALDKSTDIDKLGETFDAKKEALEEVKVVVLNVLPDTSYPEDYDYETEGLYTEIYSPESNLPADVTVVVVEITNPDLINGFENGIEETMVDFEEDIQVVFGFDVRLLKDGAVYEADYDQLTVSVVLPNDMKLDGLTLICDDIHHHYVEIQYDKEGQVITFDATDLSHFYLIGAEEEAVNLWPYIGLLVGIIGVEIFAIKRKKQIEHERFAQDNANK